MKYSISVILPNYNGKHLLEAFLPHTYAAMGESGLDYEIIVVDDCSTDNSVKFLNDKYPEIKVLNNTENSGFSKPAIKEFKPLLTSSHYC
jgi:glycosyltransferase involved in cell wall biosynthesis